MASNNSSSRKPNWLELPKEITENIFHRLGAVEIVTSTRNVCSQWWNICKDPLMWRTVDMRSKESDIVDIRPIHVLHQLRGICRYIVDQSRGHLESISIGDFASDEILEYIAARASQLRRLELEASCWNFAVSNAGVCAILDRCPLLESFHLDKTFAMLDESLLERCKEQVKDFRLNKFWLEFMPD